MVIFEFMYAMYVCLYVFLMHVHALQMGKFKIRKELKKSTFGVQFHNCFSIMI